MKPPLISIDMNEQNEANLSLIDYTYRKLDEINSLFNKGGKNISSSISEFEKIQKYAFESFKKLGENVEFCNLRPELSRFGDIAVELLSVCLTPEERVVWYSAQLKLAEFAQDEDAVRYTQGNLGKAIASRGDASAGLELMQSALQRATSKDDRHHMCLCKYDIGTCYLQMNQVEKSYAALMEALQMSNTHGFSNIEGKIYGALATLAADRGEFDDAVKLTEKRIEFARQNDDLVGKLAGLSNACYIGVLRQDYLSGLKQGLRAVRLARQIRYHWAEAHALGNIGICFRHLGKLLWSKRCHEGALILSRRLGDRRSECEELGNLGSTLILLGQLDLALKALQASEEVATDIDDLRLQRNAIALQGELSLMSNSVGTALERFRFVKALSVAIGDTRGVTVASERIGHCETMLLNAKDFGKGGGSH